MTQPRLKHACTDAGQYGLNIAASEYVEEGVRLLRTSDLSSNGAVESDGIFIRGPVESRFLVRGGDILLSRSGTIGQAFSVPEPLEGSAFAGFLVRFRADESGCDPRFIYFTTQSESFQGAIQSDAVTSTISNFNADRYANIPIRLPPLDEQRRIADFLDDQTTRIDKAIQLRQQQSEALLTRTRSQVAEVVDGLAETMVPLRRFLKVRQETERIDLPVLSVYRDHGVILKSTRTDNFNKTPEDLSRYQRVGVGDLVVNKMKAWSGSVAVSNHEGIVSPDYLVCQIDVGLRPFYLHHVLRSARWVSEMRIRSKGIRPAQERLYWDDLAAIQIPAPSIEMQDELLSGVFARLYDYDEVKLPFDRAQALLKERKRSLISAAVTGEFDVSSASARAAGVATTGV